MGAADPTLWPPRLRWLTGLSVAAVIAVNAAGIWSIAVARRGVVDDAARVFRLEVAARARAIESALASTRADLAYLAGSSAFPGLEPALSSTDPREVRWRRLGAEGALLLFLRGHPEVRRIAVMSVAGRSLVQAGRRGGVPVVWAASASAGSKAERAQDERPITARLEMEAAPDRPSEGVKMEADLDATALLAQSRGPAAPERTCWLRDAAGEKLSTESGRSAEASSDSSPAARSDSGDGPRDAGAWIRAESPVRAEGLSARGPWNLSCAQSEGPTIALLEPATRRYRIALGINVVVMALAFLLGGIAIQQARRRERLEAIGREEARVRELERQLFHSERLGTVGRLAAGMAHEINNPLEGMSNYLALAREDLARGDAASARTRLEGVRSGLERAAGVVRQILTHSDPASAPHVPVDLNETLRSSVEFVRSRREFSSIEFHLDLKPGKATVKGNQVMLGQVFLNLILNACEAQPGGGEVLLATANGDGSVIVEIADRGPGVPAEHAARIFEPFYSTKESTGLGLSICFSIVRQHAGDLSVEPRPGGGALFRLRLPAWEAALA